VAYYNDVRPHRARDRLTPRAAFESRARAEPGTAKTARTKELRVRHDKIDKDGSVTLRYRGRLHHIGMGRALKGTRVILLVAGRSIRVLSGDGELLRELTLDCSRDYQPRGRS
jgi:hypothetical protein